MGLKRKEELNSRCLVCCWGRSQRSPDHKDGFQRGLLRGERNSR